MTVARGAAVGALAAAVIVAAVLMFGANSGTEYKLRFENAGQLVKGNEVKVGGLPVGKIKDISLTDDNQAEVKIEVNHDFAPLHQGTTAMIRASSLSGIANRYILLSPGPNDALEIPEDGLLAADKTATAVDLDQLFNTLDPSTRKGLQEVLKGFATQYAGQGTNANRSYKYLAPALSSTAELEQQLIADQQVFTRFILDASKAVTAIADRRDDLAALVSNGNALSRAIGRENVALGQAIGLLPSTLRQGSETFVHLRSTLDDLDALTNATRGSIKGLAPFLQDLGSLADEARPAIRDFRYILNNPGRHNDLTDLTEQFPSLQTIASKAFSNSERALKKGQPVMEFIRPYAPDLSAWITHFANIGSYYDANGHYARVMPIFDAFSYDEGTNTLTPLDSSQRKSVVNEGGVKRCPGAATQSGSDGSNPFTDGGKLTSADCDPSVIPPGP